MQVDVKAEIDPRSTPKNIDDLEAVLVTQGALQNLPWLKSEALSNIDDILVTRLTFQTPRGWLKVLAK